VKREYSENIIGVPDGVKLGGRGDLYFQRNGELTRLQGYYITPQEIDSRILSLQYQPIERIDFIGEKSTNY
jgi:hypothetical protein